MSFDQGSKVAFTEKSHWIHRWPTCVHMGPTCVVPISHIYPHVRKIFWHVTHHVRSSVHMYTPCAPHKPTCGFIWGSYGVLFVNIMLTGGKDTWNCNNTRNPHVDFVLFFRKGAEWAARKWSAIRYNCLWPTRSQALPNITQHRKW